MLMNRICANKLFSCTRWDRQGSVGTRKEFTCFIGFLEFGSVVLGRLDPIALAVLVTRPQKFPVRELIQS